MNYYNEHDPKAAAWLRELIAHGLIPPGDVDERSILEVRPHEITRYTQHHFFAGIGGWSLALRLAGWPDDRPVRSGSCPCQPFSQAGKGLGVKDERHLWPVFRDLITFGEPTVTFGEQVASKAGREWLSGIRADLEGLGYAVGAADLCASGAGAPHIRQRLYWVADPFSGGLVGRTGKVGQESGRRQLTNGCDVSGLADSNGLNRSGKQRLFSVGGRDPRAAGEQELAACGVGDADSSGLGKQCGAVAIPTEFATAQLRGNAWDSFDILYCTDGKARRVESGTFPLAHGVPHRVVRLRGYGNAIVPKIAAEFIQAYNEAVA